MKFQNKVELSCDLSQFVQAIIQKKSAFYPIFIRTVCACQNVKIDSIILRISIVFYLFNDTSAISLNGMIVSNENDKGLEAVVVCYLTD